MIFDTISNCNLYNKNIPAFRKAFDFIQSFDVTLKDGTYSLDGTDCIASVITKQTNEESDILFEYHKRHIDLHYILQGEERCGYFSQKTATDTDYDVEKDLGFYPVPHAVLYIPAHKDDFYIVWPHELHKPLLATNEKNNTVRKIIIKIPV